MNSKERLIKYLKLNIEDFEPHDPNEYIDEAICEIAEMMAAQDEAICELAELIAGGVD